MKSHLVPVRDLTAGDRAEMFHLLQQHFAGVRIDVFQADLRDKNWVLLLRDINDELKGFSTIAFYHTAANGLQTEPMPDEASCRAARAAVASDLHPEVPSSLEPARKDSARNISVVYSGDTIMDPSAWSSMMLAKSWIDAINTLKHLYATETLYWFLISSGYRTYRFLPIFWREFYPRYDAPTPLAIQNLMDHLAREKFGDRYDAAAGIVRLDHPQALRDELAGIPTERLSDPHIEFFAQKNPTHSRGDELVCLTKISEENLTRAGRRMWFANLPCDVKRA